MSQVPAQLPSLVEDIAGLGDAPENLLWKPQNTESHKLSELRRLINQKYDLRLKTYHDLHRWSVEHYDQFWAEVWTFTGIVSSKVAEVAVDTKTPINEIPSWGREAAQVKRGIEAERRQLLAQLDFVRQRVMESRQESKKIEMEDDQAKSRLHDVQESIKESQSLITVAHEECIQAAHESRHVRSEAIDLEAQQRHLEEAWQSISRDGARRIASLEGEAQELRQTVTNAENGFLERSDGPALIDGSVARQELWEVDRRIQNSQQGLNDALLQLQHQGSQLRDWQHRFESGAEPEPEGGATNGAILGENPANALQEELQRGRKELEALQEHAAHCRAEASAADAAASSAMGDLHFLESRSYGANGSKVTAAREQQLEAEVQLVRDQLEFAATEKERVQKDLQVAMKKLNGARSNPSRSVGGVPKLPPPERLT